MKQAHNRRFYIQDTHHIIQSLISQDIVIYFSDAFLNLHLIVLNNQKINFKAIRTPENSIYQNNIKVSTCLTTYTVTHLTCLSDTGMCIYKMYLFLSQVISLNPFINANTVSVEIKCMQRPSWAQHWQIHMVLL